MRETLFSKNIGLKCWLEEMFCATRSSRGEHGKVTRQELELNCLMKYDDLDVVMQIDNDKMCRMLNMPILRDGRKINDANLIAEAIADYVNFLDRMIKLFFENADNRKRAVTLIEDAYKERLKTVKVLV